VQQIKNFNQTVYILFIITIYILFSSVAMAHIVSSNSHPGKPGHKVTFTSTLTFNGQNGTANGYIDYGDGTPEETFVVGLVVPFVNFFSKTYVTTHTYIKPGNYTVRVRTITGGAAIASGPNPAIMNQQIKHGIYISRIKLYFENNRPEITLNRNQSPPGLFAKIDFEGSGYIKGFWEIDGKRQSYVSRYIAKGRSITLNYPAAPPIPTFKYGTHKVRFVITAPHMNIKFPYALYFITSDEREQIAEIQLLQPAEGEDIAYEPIFFLWKPVPKALVYLITVFSKTRQTQIFAAYTRKNEYALKSNILMSRIKPEEKYIWNVIGFNDQNEITAESIPSLFSVNQKSAFVPGHILFITRPTKRGRQVIQAVKKKYGLKILDSYPIEVLGMEVTEFYTDRDISGIIDELKLRRDVVDVQPDFVFKTMSGPVGNLLDEPMNNMQSIRKIIKIDPDLNFKGRGVKIAVVDTGVDVKHKDLKGAVSFKKNCMPRGKYLPEIHGTAVAGLIGARKNNFGIEGYAPESEIFALRACRQISKTQPRGECYSSSIARALDIAIKKDVQIINMSLGTSVKDKLISRIIKTGAEHGIIFVAPAGNNRELYDLSFPASHPDVISVAGIAEDGTYFPNAKVAEKADFYLPCDNLFSTIPHNKHNFLSGTSLSGAVVSGLLALSHGKNRDYILARLKSFDGDMNKWVNKYLMTRSMAVKKNN